MRQGHGFDSWFRSAEAYDGLHAAGQVSCPVCGDAQVEKTLMAPAVRPARKAAVAEKPDLKAPASDVEKALAELRRQVEENSDYVGMNFRRRSPRHARRHGARTLDLWRGAAG